jgi:hypothetical protein
VYQLERPKDSLPLEEFAVESFVLTGQLIEAVMLPFLRGFLYIVRIADGGQQRDIQSARALHLGRIVGELNGHDEFIDLFSPAPWHMPLNQWRNIAQHQSYEIVGDKILCRYGAKDKTKEIALTRDELFFLVRRIFRIYVVIKTARILFLMDNADALSDRKWPDTGRDDQQAFNFAILASSQGFEASDLVETETEISVVLRECSDMDPSARRFHASQFAYVLWTKRPKPYAKVEYREKDGTPSLITRVSGKDCEEIRSGKIEFHELATRADMQPLKKY